jgi:methanogenic corrinoid protein MtbC1
LIDRLNFGDLIGLFEVLALMNKAVLERLMEAVVKFDVDAVKEACDDALQQKISAYEIVTEGMAKGMEVKMADTINALVEAGIRDRVKVILR